METIGAKILEIRNRKGLTQEKLSDLSKINLRTLQRIEKGTTEPRSDTLNNICRVLEVNVEDLLNYQIFWSILFYFSFTLWAILKISNWGHANLFLYVGCVFYVTNIVYPIIISRQISKGILRKFYFTPIEFLKP